MKKITTHEIAAYALLLRAVTPVIKGVRGEKSEARRICE
jgi:hypothetical protein